MADLTVVEAVVMTVVVVMVAAAVDIITVTVTAATLVVRFYSCLTNPSFL